VAGFVILAGATLGAVVIAGFSAGGGVENIVTVAVDGGLVGSCTIVLERVAGGGVAAGTLIAAAGCAGCVGITEVATGGFSAGGGIAAGTFVTAAG
jgi:hypothetical protein